MWGIDLLTRGVTHSLYSNSKNFLKFSKKDSINHFYSFTPHLLYNIVNPTFKKKGARHSLQIMQDTILQLLSQPNITQADVAKVLNVTESYVSQIVSAPDFQQKLSAARVKNLVEETEHDDKLSKTEAKALERVHTMLDYVTKPIEAARIFQILNTAKRRGVTEAEKALVVNSQNTVVMLQLPDVVKQKFITNANNEVVQIGDRPMVTMDSQLLLAKAKENENE